MQFRKLKETYVHHLAIVNQIQRVFMGLVIRDLWALWDSSEFKILMFVLNVFFLIQTFFEKIIFYCELSAMPATPSNEAFHIWLPFPR